MQKNIEEASDNDDFKVAGPKMTIDHQFRIENDQEFSFFDFAQSVSQPNFPLTFSYNSPTVQVKEVSTKRGIGRKSQFLFLKDLVASNRVTRTWDVDKTEYESEDIPVIQEEEEPQPVMVNLKQYLSKVVLNRKVSKKPKRFARANVTLPLINNNSNCESLLHQTSSVIPSKSAMAQPKKLVSASIVGSENAPMVAFNIPMKTMEAFKQNEELLKEAKIEAGLASIDEKFVSVNVLERQQYAFKQFCVDNNLSIINSHLIKIFVPQEIAKYQFLVTKKVSTAIEHMDTSETPEREAPTQTCVKAVEHNLSLIHI